MNVREIITEVETLTVGSEVEFTDSNNVTHYGEIVEFQRHDEHNDWLVKSKTENVPDSVLELWFDPEGGPVEVKVSFEFQESREVTSLNNLSEE